MITPDKLKSVNSDSSLLNVLGIRRSIDKVVVFFIAALFLFMAICAAFYEPLRYLITPFVAISGFIVAYYQWVQVRRDDSFEKSLDRLNYINSYVQSHPEVTKVVPHLYGTNSQWSEEETKQHMYVYLELDLLEHAIDKYQRGLSFKQDLLERLHTFSSRCHAGSPFGELSKCLVKKASYNQTITNVVPMIVDDKNIRQMIQGIRHKYYYFTY